MTMTSPKSQNRLSLVNAKSPSPTPSMASVATPPMSPVPSGASTMTKEQKAQEMARKKEERKLVCAWLSASVYSALADVSGVQRIAALKEQKKQTAPKA